MSVTVDSADGLRPLAAAKSPSGASLARLREWEANGELLERAWGALVEQEREVSRLKSLLAAVPKAGPVPAGEYPPLPEPLRESYRIWSGGWLFTAGQMRAYADTTCARRAQAAPQPAVQQGDELPREDFAWLVVQEACETEPADEDDPECIRILRRDLKSAVLSAFLRHDAAHPAASVAPGDAEDAARWRMLPAFIEAHQIDYVRLLKDIDAARSQAKEGGAT